MRQRRLRQVRWHWRRNSAHWPHCFFHMHERPFHTSSSAGKRTSHRSTHGGTVTCAARARLVSGVVQGSGRGGRARLRLERAQPLGGVRDLRALLAQLELQRVDLLVRYETVGLHERRGGHQSERDDRAERPRADGAAAARLALDDRRRRRAARAAEERDAHLAVAAERNALGPHGRLNGSRIT